MRAWLVPAAALKAVLLFAVLIVAAPDAARGEPNCTCRAGGQSHALGTCTCIVTPSGARLACCAKVLNNTSWNFIRNYCPIAQAPAETPAGATSADPADHQVRSRSDQPVRGTPVAG